MYICTAIMRLAHGVIGNTADFGSVIRGSSPCEPTMFFQDLIQVLFPKYCCHCGDILSHANFFICTNCNAQLAPTDFFKVKHNELFENLSFIPNLHAATALFYFQKQGVVQSLIHQIKYNRKPEIGIWLGKWLGKLINEHPFDHKIDWVIPVPLHKDKLKKRGYNQVSLFGKAIAQNIGAKLHEDVLIRDKMSDSQTHKNKHERYISVKNAFSVKSGITFENINVLIVDDVITTGATLEGCSKALQNAGAKSISVASIAYAFL